MRLFAHRGYEATKVGQIEEAAGLQPRRGGLYKHFESKQALLEAAVQEHLDSAATGATQIGAIDLDTLHGADATLLRPLVAAVGRWFLDEMDRLEDLTRVFEHDAERLAVLADEVRTKLVDLSYEATERIITALAPKEPDPAATALVILGPLVALRRTTWTYGRPPRDISDDAALDRWSQAVLTILTSSQTPVR